MPLVIPPRIHDLGGFEVRRAVPTLQARSIGPFVFVDQMGPAVFEPGRGVDVRPHPHIGLATVTFLWSGVMRHRDSLGSVQDIRAGDVNWMTAGRGIVHSERTPPELREAAHPLHGMQTWLALPHGQEEVAPGFAHHGADTLPQWQRDGALVRVVAGRAWQAESPVSTFSDTLYVALDLQPDAELVLDTEHVERALYVLEGTAQLDGADLPARHLVVLDAGSRPQLRALTPLKAMLLGGEPLDGRRHLWWNFVASSKERIEQAKLDWTNGRFGTIHGETEQIPLPAA